MLLLPSGRIFEELCGLLGRLRIAPREQVVALAGLCVAAQRAMTAVVAVVWREVPAAELAVHVVLFGGRCLRCLGGGGDGGRGGGLGGSKQLLADTAASWVTVYEAVEVSCALVAVGKLLLDAVFAAGRVAALRVVVPHLAGVAVGKLLLAIGAQGEVVLHQAVKCVSAFAAIGGPQDLVPVDGRVGGCRHVVGVGGVESRRAGFYFMWHETTLTSFDMRSSRWRRVGLQGYR